MAGPQAPLLETFERYARAAGAQVLTPGDDQAAARAIAGLAGAEAGPLRWTASARESYPGIYRALQEAGIPVSVAEEAIEQAPDRSTAAAWLAGGMGVVLARAGIAETGSLVLADNTLAGRLVSMLCEVCVALLPASGVVPSLDQAAPLLTKLEREGQLYVSLVTGPSRTADIERELTIGVQGPRALYVVVTGDQGSGVGDR